MGKKKRKVFRYVFEKDGQIYKFRTQTEIAQHLGITQQAVSLRKCKGETLAEIFRDKGEDVSAQKRVRRARERKAMDDRFGYLDRSPTARGTETRQQPDN